MSTQEVIDLLRHMLITTFWLSLPLLGIGFMAGVVLSLIQIITSMQDSAFATVPRLAAFLVATFLALPWMLGKLIEYTVRLFSDFGRYAG